MTRQIWLDYSFARPNLAQMKRDGVHGVLRYLCPINSQTVGKVIDLPERHAIEAAGLDWALGFEYYSTRAFEGRAAGLEDGLTALHQAQQLGYKRGRCIYPAHDTGARDDPQVRAYLEGFESRIAAGGYVLGIYSGVDTVDAMLVDGPAKKGWQTGAWSYGHVSTLTTLYQNLRQWFGGACDENVVLRGSVGSQHEPLPGDHPQGSGHPIRHRRRKHHQPKPIPGGGKYRVRSGDTLASIAARHATTWQVLARINHLSNPDRIFVGQELVMPAGRVKRRRRPIVRHRRHTVTVRSGDTLSAIAARVGHGCTWQDLQRVNRLKNVNLIYPGEVLRIP
jgi:LysM repeat protein